ncbi:MAG: hypothetical protein KDE14_02030, partial [Rhodobacteraceae bacterium]|nr:hypothetical protein [Paracoccaceae bacterium]
ALAWTALMTIAPKHFDVPLTALSGVALALFTIKTVKTIWLHRAKVGSGIGGALASALTGLSLSFTVGKGVIAGLLTSSKPFLRTPKCANAAPWTRAFRIAASEAALLLATLLAIAGTVWVTQVDDPAELVWISALAVMAVPYAAALIVALGSTLRLRMRPARQPDLTPPHPVPQPNLDLAA